MSPPLWTENGAYVALSHKGTRDYTLIFPPGWKARAVKWLVKVLIRLPG